MFLIPLCARVQRQASLVSKPLLAIHFARKCFIFVCRQNNLVRIPIGGKRKLYLSLLTCLRKRIKSEMYSVFTDVKHLRFVSHNCTNYVQPENLKIIDSSSYQMCLLYHSSPSLVALLSCPRKPDTENKIKFFSFLHNKTITINTTGLSCRNRGYHFRRLLKGHKPKEIELVLKTQD